MVRNYKKVKVTQVTQEKMDLACQQVIQHGRSARSVAKEYGLCNTTLSNYVRKLNDPNLRQPPKVGYNPKARVFTEEQEQELVIYIVKAAELFYGLNIREIRKLAYECAKLKNLTFPSKWQSTGAAGIDWYYDFMKRHPQLSLRSPQPTSLSRATSFNKSNVELFFQNLEKVFEKHNFDGQFIYNVDETGITTVHRPNRIVTLKGSKNVGAFTSAERGTLVTLCIAVSATGNSIPPHFIFPRKIYRDHFIQGGPSGSIGSCTPSGWMGQDEFLVFIKHFAKCTGATIERKMLLLLDNHDSHISIPVIDFCKANGIVLLSFPPHCSHKLQPLDRSVYGPLKKYFNSYADIWMQKHPGKPMTIYDIPGIVKEALPQTLTQSNIMSGFKCTGIYPFNKGIFKDSDFNSSYVTDRPEIPQESTINPQTTEADKSVPAGPSTSGSEAAGPLTSGSEPAGPSSSESRRNSPLEIENHFPFAKAGPRKVSNRGRKRMKSSILTDTPVRNELHEKKLASKAKKTKKSEKTEPHTPVKKISKTIPKKLN